MTWRPPSARDVSDDRFDRLHEGVPSWLSPSLIRWVAEFLMRHHPMKVEVSYDIALVNEMALAVRFDPPLPTTASARDLVAAILQRFGDNSPQAIDVLDFLARASASPLLVADVGRQCG